jgi:hypothetical protein
MSGQSRKNCRLRTAIEERHRQLKCYSDLEAFTSRAFSLVAHQVVFYSSHVQPDAMVLAADRPKGTQSQDPNAYHGPSTSDRHSYCHLLQELRLRIPDQVGHRFRSKLATDSGLKLATYSGGKLATFPTTPEWVANMAPE